MRILPTMKDEIAWLDAVAQADLVRRGEVTPAELVEQAWMLALSRPPTDAERNPFEEMLTAAAPEERRSVVEDMYWSLLTSRKEGTPTVQRWRCPWRNRSSMVFW